MKDYRTALEKDEDLQRAKEGLAKAQKLEKQASKRDYYKILGVKRTATKKDINKVSTSKKKIQLPLQKQILKYSSWKLKLKNVLGRLVNPLSSPLKCI